MYLLLLAVLAATLVLSVLVGASSLSTSDLWHAFTGRFNPRALSEQEQLADTILWSIRLPRTLVAALCGGALAAAGATSQGLFRNGLASPSVLGTESGGAFAAALVFYVGAAGWHWLTMPVAAFTGC